MSEAPQDNDLPLNTDEKNTVLFMQMVFQLSSLATMLLGKAPHPDTGKTVRDLEAAQVMIDQLEMLETKTKGNLSREEEQLLRQTLMSLRMAYVDAVNHPDKADKSDEPPKEEPATTADAGEPQPEPAAEESKKKFSKKY